MTIWRSGTYPTMRSTGSPPLKRMRLGMLDTSYLPAMLGDSSVLSLTTFKRPFMSFATLSTIGPTILHGPHQGAQKSTRTGVADCRTWTLKSASPTSTASLTGDSFGYSLIQQGEPAVFG